MQLVFGAIVLITLRLCLYQYDSHFLIVNVFCIIADFVSCDHNIHLLKSDLVWIEMFHSCVK
jgi:hypothetical protein